MRHFAPTVSVLCVGLLTLSGVCAHAAPVPSAIAEVVSFRGHLGYRAHRADDPSLIQVGTLVVRSDGWTLDEQSPREEIHISNTLSWIRNGSQTAVLDDPLDVDFLANSWALLLGASSNAQLLPDPGGLSWTTSAGARVYLDSERSRVSGAADTRAGSGVSFVYSDWIDVRGLGLPQSIVRLRNGLTDASFSIDGYQVDWTSNATTAVANRIAAPQRVAAEHMISPLSVGAVYSAQRAFTIALTLFVIALGFVAWTRRDAFVERLGQRLAADPRAWRDEGTNVFISPEGTMRFEGRVYRVGSAFYSRTALVQSSPLFIRVSAPGEPRVIIAARKFPLPVIFERAARHSASATAGRKAVPSRRSGSGAGFTLFETLAASALFAAVVLAAVFPALVVLAHADRLAAQRQLALQVALNALTDEQAALAYGDRITDESAVSTVDDLKLTQTISPSDLAGLHSLTVDVSDASGRTLVKLVTQLGPPVPAPGAPSTAPQHRATR